MNEPEFATRWSDKLRAFVKADLDEETENEMKAWVQEFEPQPPQPYDEIVQTVRRRRRVDPVTVWAWVGALSFCAGVWGIAITWLVER